MEVYEVRVYEDRVEWWQNDKFHRLDGPAVECASGYKAWLQNGKLHRLDGPAVECASGYKAWWQNGKRHRLDGPAIEQADGSKAYFIEGEELSEEEFNKRSKPCLGKKILVDGIEYTLS